MLNQYKITVNHTLVSKLAKEIASWKKARERERDRRAGGRGAQIPKIVGRDLDFKFVKQETQGDAEMVNKKCLNYLHQSRYEPCC